MKLSLLFFILLSCSKYDDYKYETREMAIYNADNSGNSPVDTGNAVNKKAYGIRLRFGMVLTDNSGDTDN